MVGVDFSLGYPAGTAAALGLDGVPWRAMWTLLADLVVDAPDNTNNRFDVATELNRRMGDGPGPFWGCPPNRSSAWLTATKTSPAPIPEWRTTEAVVRERGHRPFTAWQLLGAGSVGSQSLVGIPALVRVEAALRRAGRTVDVWPFTAPAVSSPAAAPGDVVIGEVWPSLYPLGALDGRVRDEVQVIQTAHRLHHDIDRSPIHRFDECVVREEGWVWGA